MYYDRHATDLPKLRVADAVRIQPNVGLGCQEGEVLGNAGYRSYIVAKPEGARLRRNRRYLQKTTKSAIDVIADKDDDIEVDSKREQEQEDITPNAGMVLKYEFHSSRRGIIC